jgi:hypothetical protein
MRRDGLQSDATGLCPEGGRFGVLVGGQAMACVADLPRLAPRACLAPRARLAHLARRLGATLLVAQGCLASTNAFAQTAEPAQPADAGNAGSARPTLRDSLGGSARAAYDEATALLDAKDDRGALEKYQRAYALSKDPRLLFDMAVCDRDLGRYAQMQTYLLRYEQEEAGQMPAEQVAQIHDALAAIRHLVAQIRLTVNEPGAEASVDGEIAGLTPLAAPLIVDVGTHTLTVQKDGFAPAERKVDVKGGEDTEIALELVEEPRTGTLRVDADPRAVIAVDRTLVARGSFEQSIPPGTHGIQVTESGKKPFSTSVTLRSRESREILVRLEDEPHAPIWPWITAGVAVVAGVTVGAYFLFKQPDNRSSEPSGQLFTVQLPSGSP